VTDELLISGERAVELVGLIFSLDYQIKPLTERRQKMAEQLKQYLLLSSEDSLSDGEVGAVARIQERNGATTYDLVSCVGTEDGELAILQAAAAGMLRVDHAMLDRFRKGNGAVWADTLARYAMPGPPTYALYVERNER
jgi:hypothetical protein